MRTHLKSWSLWIALNVLVGAYFGYALLAPASSVKASLLPGKTTHGHYQIELDCDACHAASETATSSVGAFMQDACNQCHAAQLRQAKDTHPAKKFNDPTNAELLLTLDAQDCLTCHKEHVPERTLEMGLTIPSDYCWHCHQDVAEHRPSHEGMSFTSCSTAGCHNYHNNRALYEKYLNDHFGEPDVLDPAVIPVRRNAAGTTMANPSLALAIGDADASVEDSDANLLEAWATTAHAAAGVNCSHCHARDQRGADVPWRDAVPFSICRQCHEREAETFLTGRHGMRLASGMSPMSPSAARLPMHAGAGHRELTCTACHDDHRFDTAWAAVEACQKCHADAHTQSYDQSVHADLWKQEVAGTLPTGTGVSCASCHLPRIRDGDDVWVRHDQNANLRPNETMAREVCMHCHGLEYALSALADDGLIENCFSAPPSRRVDSVAMARRWFQQQEKKRQLRKRRRDP